MRKQIKLLLACSALVLTATTVGAQETKQQESTPAVQSGDYKPLTFWRTIGLGSSYFTNPTVASTANVAYSFDGPEFSGQLYDSLWKLAQQGKISFGITDKDKKSITVVPLAQLQKVYPVSGPADLAAVVAKDDVTIVTNDKVLLGAASSMPVVKTPPSK